MAKIHIVHFRIENPHHDLPMVDNCGGTTVAYFFEEGTITFACSYCHENDNFNRRTGRVKATGRLNSDRYKETIPFAGPEKSARQFLKDRLGL